MAVTASQEQVHRLISRLESTDETFLSALEFYHLGLILRDNAEITKPLEEYFMSLPNDFLSKTLRDLTQAYKTVVISQESTIDDIRTASISIGCLFRHSPIICLTGFSSELCLMLSQAYNILSSRTSNWEAERSIFIDSMESILIHGFLPSLKNSEDRTQKVVALVQILCEDDEYTFVGDTLHASNSTFIHSIGIMFDSNPEERDYLVQMLENCPTSKNQGPNTASEGKSTNQMAKGQKDKSTLGDPKLEIQRRIQKVKDVLPDLGDGYIECALSLFDGDVSSTVSALLDPSSLPPTLQLLDSKLPSRRKETATSTSYVLDDDEAKRLIKERHASLERQQELEAYALTVVNKEYDDDYDDQYDEMDAVGDLGGKGSTYDDISFAQIKIYNRAVRETESEQQYWNENRNVNRDSMPNLSNSKDTSIDEGKAASSFRGPDKAKGGRILGPDGKVLPKSKQKQQPPPPNMTKATTSASQSKVHSSENPPGSEKQDSSTMSKIQKRRKNDNKAKIGNHHRKDRAGKKQNGLF
jgi:CUE domain